MSAFEGNAPARPSETVAGFLAALSIFIALIGVAWHPLRLIGPAIVVSLVAAAMGGRHERLFARFVREFLFFPLWSQYWTDCGADRDSRSAEICSADSDCASLQKRASLPTPSSVTNFLRASDRPAAKRIIVW